VTCRGYRGRDPARPARTSTLATGHDPSVAPPARTPTEEDPVSRAHCLDCGDHVVVDPAGRCPEGHHVGVAGARIEGALGSHTPHPDEPEPWVARVDLDEEDLSPTPAAPAREIRPLSVPAAEPPLDGAGSTSSTGRSEDLLRELHSLGDLGDLAGRASATSAAASSAPSAPSFPEAAEPPAVWTAPAAATPAPATPVTPAAPPSPAPSSRPAFDELTALEAAVQALTADRDVATTNGHISSNGHADMNGQAETNGLASSNGHGPRLEELLGPETPGGASAPTSSSPPPGPASSVPHEDAAESGPERWSVLADVAELAEHRPAPPAPPAPSEASSPQAAIPTAPPAEAAPAEPPPPAPAADTGIDLGNFTARGKRVGSTGKRRLFGR
jgi:hypothetical protein